MADNLWHHGPEKAHYSVYNNKTDMPVMIDGTAEECARAMGVRITYFYKVSSLSQRGLCRKWCIIRQDKMEEETEDECY